MGLLAWLRGRGTEKSGTEESGTEECDTEERLRSNGDRDAAAPPGQLDPLPKELDPDEPVVLPVTDALDLHPFQPREVKDVTASYLEAALEAGFEEVRIIHGRGIGVQREIVRKLLADHPAVATYTDAGPDRGGWGATLVRLRVPQSRRS